MMLPLFTSAVYAQDEPFECGRHFTGGPETRPPEWEYNLPSQWTFEISDQQYYMSYDGGTISNGTVNVTGRSIEFLAQPDLSPRPDSFMLPVRLPRALIDSTQDGIDVPFTVIANGQPIDNVTEDVVPSTGDRMLCITLPVSDTPQRIEIIGTTIAPEFGSFAMILASITFAGIVAFRVMSGRQPRM